MHLKQHGWSQRDIAAALGAAEETVSRWVARARHGGPEALLARPSPGHPPKLTDQQKRLIPDFLWHGPEAYGFRGEVWTCARVAQVIAEEFGVRYHKGHVSRLLQELRWTPQMPIRRALQRDEAAIARRGITLTCVCVAGESQWVLRALPPLVLRVLGLLNLPVSLYTDLVHPGVTEHPQPRSPAILLTG